MIIKKAIAEIIGTFTLVLIGTGAVVFSGGPEEGLLTIAFGFGLAVVIMAYSVGTVSGAHLNPAVSLAMFVNKRLSGKELLTYILAQLIGAVLGSLTLLFFLKSAGITTGNIGANTLAPGLSIMGGFMIEAILTFLFVLVIMTVTGKNGNPQLAGLVIGLALTALIIIGAKTSGASLNPARSFGPAVFHGGEAMSQLWLYTAGPIVGGVLAAIVAKFALDTELGSPGPEREKLAEEK